MKLEFKVFGQAEMRYLITIEFSGNNYKASHLFGRGNMPEIKVQQPRITSEKYY